MMFPLSHFCCLLLGSLSQTNAANRQEEARADIHAGAVEVCPPEMEA